MKPPCPNCGNRENERDDRFDAYFCAPCNVWIEAACASPEFCSCVGRPERPLRTTEVTRIEIVSAPGDACGNTKVLPDGSKCPGCRACA